MKTSNKLDSSSDPLRNTLLTLFIIYSIKISFSSMKIYKKKRKYFKAAI
jgi:hypothetical protein